MIKFEEIKEEVYNIIKGNSGIAFTRIVDYLKEDTKKQLMSYWIGVVKQIVLELEEEKRIKSNLVHVSAKLSVV